MVTFQEFQHWAETYAKLFAVISGAVILLSWLFENLWGKQLDAMKADLDTLQKEKKASQRFRTLQGKLLEVYQITTGLRRRLNQQVDPATQDLDTWTYELGEKLEVEGVNNAYLGGTIDFANTIRDYLRAIDPPDELNKKVEEAYKELQELSRSFEQAREDRKRKMADITGQREYIPFGLLDNQVGQLNVLINAYIGQIGRLSAEHARISNQMNEVYFEVFDFVHRKVARTERFQRKVKYAQLTLFIIGTLLAIYGLYLESLT